MKGSEGLEAIKRLWNENAMLEERHSFPYYGGQDNYELLVDKRRLEIWSHCAPMRATGQTWLENLLCRAMSSGRSDDIVQTGEPRLHRLIESVILCGRLPAPIILVKVDVRESVSISERFKLRTNCLGKLVFRSTALAS
jgi:hypothetical protein